MTDPPVMLTTVPVVAAARSEATKVGELEQPSPRGAAARVPPMGHLDAAPEPIDGRHWTVLD